MSDDRKFEAEFFTWLKAGNSGCLFARLLAINPARGKWETVVIRGVRFDEKIPELLHQSLAEAIGSSEAVTLLFPDIKTAADILGLIQSLIVHPNWHCVEFVSDEMKNPTVLIGVRWLAPDRKFVNWTIGFADLDSMPPTRRAPHTAIVVRIGEPGVSAGIRKGDPEEPMKRKPEGGRLPIHVADVGVLPLLKNKEQLIKLWDLTLSAKQERLKDSDLTSAARAKITFSLPEKFRREFQAIAEQSIKL